MAKFSHYPTRREKDYFAVPNRIYSCGLDTVAIVVYCYLLFNQYGKWFPPLVDREKLATELKLSDAVIAKRIRLLVARNLVCLDEDYLYVVQKRENRPWNFWLKPKEEEIKNHFLLPKEVFTLDLSAGEIAVYGYLLCCENRVTYQCYPGYQTIGDAVGMSRNTVMKYVKALVDKHLIYAEPTTVWGKDGLKRNGTLLYTIRPIYEAVEYHTEMQMEQMRMHSAAKPPA